MWGAIHSAEVGDGTLECRDIPHTIQMLELFLQDDTFLSDMCQNIVTNKKAGLYDGAYKVVELAMGLKKINRNDEFLMEKRRFLRWKQREV